MLPWQQAVKLLALKICKLINGTKLIKFSKEKETIQLKRINPQYFKVFFCEAFDTVDTESMIVQLAQEHQNNSFMILSHM